MFNVLVVVILLAAAAPVAAASATARVDATGGAVVLSQGGRELKLSPASPEFVFAGETVGGERASKKIAAGVLGGRRAEVSYPPIRLKDGSTLDIRMHMQWSAKESVLRKWASYRVTGASTEPVLREVILEKLPVGGRKIDCSPSPTHSYPAFWPGFFAGIEFPIAATRIEGGNLLVAHQPGLRMKNGVWYQTRKAVFGIAEPGHERAAFRRYLEINHPRPNGLHINYNSWWTSPVPYKQTDIESLMGVFEQKLYKTNGAHFDTFCIDMGWSAPKSVWEIEKQLFPQGFSGIATAAKRMNCSLGLWISPSSCYSPAMDNEWAEKNGYETFAVDSSYQTRRACLAGERYRTALTQRLVDMVTHEGVRQIKLDGYSFECPASNHGHEPGGLSSEAMAEGFVSVMQAVRKACPDVWLEPTCFGPNPSPWWLFHTNSVTGAFGDDAPYGRVPSPVYRESYTSARDYFNLQGCALLDLPASGQDLLGIVHQSPEPFGNDAVMCVMRGNMFLPVYVNPRFMNDARWKSLAGILNWARRNAPRLAQTEPLLPVSWQNGRVPHFSYTSEMPREPYGYAHWAKGGGLVALRNPWIAPGKYSIKIEAGLGVKGLSAVSLYPEARVYGKGLKTGDMLDVPLAPYETVVISIAARQQVSGVPDAAKQVGGRIESVVRKGEIRRATDSVQFDLEGEVSVKAPQARLLIVIEDGKAVPSKPECKITVNGKETEVETRASIDTCRGVDDATEIGWAASGLSALEHWRYMVTTLAKGKSSVTVKLTANGNPSISAWVWAAKPGTATTYPNALPQPEVVSMDGMQLLVPVAKHTTAFAVVADAHGSTDRSRDWLARGVAFDIEKRLGRLPSLDVADRLDVADALQSARGSEESKVRAVSKHTGAGIVLYVIASVKGDGLSLRVDVWGKSRIASLASDGALDGLFELIDGIVDQLLPELAKAGVDVGKPASVPGLKWHPCRSVAAYEDLITAMALLQHGDAAQAKTRLLKTLQAEPDNWFARYFLGAVALRQGDIAKAAEYCREAIALNPDVYPGVYANLSYCCAAMGDDKQAEAAKAEFERRTGKTLPARSVPGGMPTGLFGATP